MSAGQTYCVVEMNGENSSLTIFIKTCESSNDRIPVITKFPSDKNVIEHIILVVLAVILFFSSVFLNGVAITAIWVCSQLKAKVSCFTVMVRSVMDLVLGLVVVPFFVTVMSNEIGGHPNCDVCFIAKKLFVLFTSYSVMVMCMMNLERYMGILHPMAHRVKVTKTRLVKYTILGFVVQTIVFTLSVIEDQVFPFVLAGTTFLLIATTVYVYIRIFVHNVKNGRQLSVQSQNAAGNRKRKLMREIKLARSSFMIVICFLACFLPATISNIERFNVQPSFSFVVWKKCFFLLVILSTTLNPIIFFWRDRALRRRGIESIERLFFSR